MSSHALDHHAIELARYHARRAAGLCGGCGGKPMPGKARCVRCAGRMWRSRHQPRRRNEQRLAVR